MSLRSPSISPVNLQRAAVRPGRRRLRSPSISPVSSNRAAARPVRRRLRSPSISPVSSNRAAARPVRRRVRSPSTSPRLRHGFRSSSVMPHNDAQLEEVFITFIFCAACVTSYFIHP